MRPRPRYVNGEGPGKLTVTYSQAGNVSDTRSYRAIRRQDNSMRRVGKVLNDVPFFLNNGHDGA